MIILSVIFLSCDTKESKFEDFINNQLNTHYLEKLDNIDTIFIMPRMGCRSCIHASEKFFLHNVDNHNILFIFTKIDNIKKLRLEIGTDNFNKNNVIVDKNNIFSYSGCIDSEYPLLLTREENNIFKYSTYGF